VAQSATVIVTLECQQCKDRNYTTTKNRRANSEKLELSKFCRRCRAHKPHKETK
jgi:large subunit ribosomal protein L33